MSLYLPHDLKAFEDDKIVNMFGDLDYYGYGLYWRVLEMLYNSDDHTKVTNYKALARVLNCKADILEQLICNYGLFVFSEDGSKFWSDRVLQQCDKMNKGKKDAAENGRKGAQKRWGSNGEPHRGAIGYPIGGLSKNDGEPIGSDSNLNNNLNLNLNAADAALIAAAAAEQNLDTQTIAPDVQQLLDAIGKRFDTIPLPAHLTALEQLISECNRPGVVNGIDVVRDGLARLDAAEAIKSGKVRLSITQFLQPKYFTRLISGDYDKTYNSKRKSGYSGAGISFEGREY